MQMINASLKGITALLMVSLLGCSQVPEQSANASQTVKHIEQIKENSHNLRQGTLFTNTVQKPQPVEVLRQAPWLSDRVTTSYGGIPAKTAIMAILQTLKIK
jgi:hypothetical protein